MFEQEPEPTDIQTAMKTLSGILLGLVAGVLVPVVVFMFVVPIIGRGGDSGFWVAEILDLGLLGGVGYLLFRKMGHSALARGMLIGVSIAFLLNVICGVAMLRGG